MPHKANWWETFFVDFRPVFGHYTRKEINAEIRYVSRKLGLKPGMSLLDCPCGYGRMSLPLAKRGIKVTGVDITPSYLEEFERNASRAGVAVRLFHQDMRRISFRNEFDAAANLYTSFGYFEEEAQNLLALKKVYQSLRPGGRFLLSLINRDWILINFTTRDWFELKGVRLLQWRSFDYAHSIMNDNWQFEKDGAVRVHKTKLRVYSYHELRAMFEQVGFVEIEGFGSHQDTPTGRNNRMIYVLGRKP